MRACVRACVCRRPGDELYWRGTYLAHTYTGRKARRRAVLAYSAKPHAALFDACVRVFVCVPRKSGPGEEEGLFTKQKTVNKEDSLSERDRTMP